VEEIKYTAIDEVVELPDLQSVSIGKGGKYSAND
jgi:hypothetical protein